ncbi:MAG: hypothetical protein RRC07_11765 [Anaerolineae bacterium]|nr:hypothetical protein [Anaerolineae bacterium]
MTAIKTIELMVDLAASGQDGDTDQVACTRLVFEQDSFRRFCRRHWQRAGKKNQPLAAPV